MKTKQLLLTLLLFVIATANAQTILKGDMNDDGDITIADVTSTVDVILGKKAKEAINLSVDPYKVDNSTVVGTWYAPDGTSFQFNEDGTTTFPSGATYEFMPMQGRLLVYDAMKNPIMVLPLLKVESEYLLVVDYATSVFTYYTNSGSLASGITLSQTTLSINSGTTAQLSATLTPEGSFGTITWTSSDESVATVDANGLVTAVAGGSCTIMATVGGSLKTATCSVTVNQLVTSITLSQAIAVLELDATVRLTATALPENAANKNVVWSSSNEDVASVKNGLVVAYNYGIATITCEAADGSGVKAICKISIPYTEYVDLGLPSGTLWATCNVGAYSPEEYGDYFAWGETDGFYSGKTNFDWTTYKWTVDQFHGYTKYCTESDKGYNGFTDNKIELDLEDDAAYMNWGSNWRMPSEEQYRELYDNNYTTSEKMSLNGIYGLKIRSNINGNFIFLPAARSYSGKNLIPAIVDYYEGNYWSRTLKPGGLFDAAYFIFDDKIITVGSGNYTRYNGRSVRPVRNTNE